MTSNTEVLGIQTAELVSMMLDSGIHTSVDRFKRLAHEIQRRGFEERDRRESVLQRMTEDAEALGLYEGRDGKD
jgi:hypothetical protein